MPGMLIAYFAPSALVGAGVAWLIWRLLRAILTERPHPGLWPCAIAAVAIANPWLAQYLNVTPAPDSPLWKLIAADAVAILVLVTSSAELWPARKKQPASSADPRVPASSRTGAGPTMAAAYCTACGSPAEAADSFCRKCGTRRKR